MKKALVFFIFLLINFGGLYLGGILMGGSPGGNAWYINLEKAPWTPPGYVFGIAWTCIMILFSIYCTLSISAILNSRKIQGLFLLQWVLNIAWNPIFFNFHFVIIGLILLLFLFSTLLIINKHLVHEKKSVRFLLIAPYLLWLCIAISLNAYVVFAN